MLGIHLNIFGSSSVVPRWTDAGNTKRAVTSGKGKPASAMESPAKMGIEIFSKRHPSVLPLLGMISMRVGRSIEWDGAKEQIVNDPKANELLSRKYRDPWKYPAV